MTIRTPLGILGMVVSLALLVVSPTFATSTASCLEAEDHLPSLILHSENKLSGNIPPGDGDALWWQEVALSRHLLLDGWGALWASLRGIKEEWTPSGSVNTGIYLYWLGFDTEAEVFLRCGLAAGEETMEAHEALAVLLHRLGRRDEALAEIQEARVFSPDDRTLALEEKLILTGERPYGMLNISRLDACYQEAEEVMEQLSGKDFKNVKVGWARARELATISYGEYIDRFVRPYGISDEMGIDLGQAHMAFRQFSFNHGLRGCISAMNLAILFEVKDQTNSQETVDAFWAEATGTPPGWPIAMEEKHRLIMGRILMTTERSSDWRCLRIAAELNRYSEELNAWLGKAAQGMHRPRENLLSYYFRLAEWGGTFSGRWFSEMVADAAFLDVPDEHPLSVHSVLAIPQQKVLWQGWGPTSTTWKYIRRFLDQRDAELEATIQNNNARFTEWQEMKTGCTAKIQALEERRREPTDWAFHWGGFKWSPQCDAKLDGIKIKVGWENNAFGFILPGVGTPVLGRSFDYRGQRVETTMGSGGVPFQGDTLVLSASVFSNTQKGTQGAKLTGAKFLGSSGPVQVGLHIVGNVHLVRHVGTRATSVLATVRPGLSVRMAKESVQATCSAGEAKINWTPRARADGI